MNDLIGMIKSKKIINEDKPIWEKIMAKSKDHKY